MWKVRSTLTCYMQIPWGTHLIISKAAGMARLLTYLLQLLRSSLLMLKFKQRFQPKYASDAKCWLAGQGDRCFLPSTSLRA